MFDRGSLTNGSVVKIKVFNDDGIATSFPIGAVDASDGGGRTRITRVQVIEFP